jgi:hypothetical protein
MKIVNKALTDLDNNVIKAGDIELTVATVIINCALSPMPPTPDGKTREEAEIKARGDLAAIVNKAAIGESFDVSPEMVVELKKDLRRLFSTLIAWRMLPIMDGNSH